MKVLLLDVNCKSGSTGKIVFDLYTSLNSGNNTAIVGYGRGKKITEPNIFKFSSKIEVYLHALMTRITGLTGCFSFFSTRRLIKLIEEYSPDIIHLHDMHGYFVNINQLIKYIAKNGFKTVWTFHCEFMYTGKCGYTFDCPNWLTQCGKCPQINEYPKSIFFDFTRKMHKDKKKLLQGLENLVIVTPSHWLANRVKQSFLGNKRIEVVYNGVNCDEIFGPKEYSHLVARHNIGGRKVVLSVAPNIMDERKGGKYVVEVAKMMRSQNVLFIMIGVENPNFDPSPNIICLSRTEDQTELAAYYSLADITLLTSSKETFSMVCAESLCCGTPVVGFDAGAPNEIAPEGYGIFVPHGATSQLAETLQAALFGEISIRTALECEKFGKQKYDQKIMCANYYCIYKSL